MGFFSNIIGAAVKTVTVPVAVVKDVVNVATGKPADDTKEHVKGIEKDVKKAVDKIT
jgi:hypothetical protein